MNQKIIFIHGLGGNAKETWGKFPELIEKSEEVKCDLDFYEYPSKTMRFPIFQNKYGSIQDLAKGLKTFITNKCKQNEDLILIGHSLGGLIIRKYLLDEKIAGSELRVKKVIFYAVPQTGAVLANIGNFLSFKHRHIKQLCKDSDFLDNLNDNWVSSGIDSLLDIKCVIGLQDKVVGTESSKTICRHHTIEVIPDKGHINIVKPESLGDMSFVILKNFINEEVFIKYAGLHGALNSEEWKSFEGISGFEFVPDEPRILALKALQELLQVPAKSARIIGSSGLGKTRLAIEVFRYEIDSNLFDEKILYVDAANGFADLPRYVSQWVNKGYSGILVVDNCDISLHEKIRKQVQRTESKISILSLDYNLDESERTEIIHLKQMDHDCIKKMLESFYGNKIEGLDKIVEFAQGFPQMAVLLADARLHQAENMGSLTNDEIAHRMLWRGREPNERIENILRTCALFDKFGLEKEAAQEFEFLANNIANINVNEFYKCIKDYEENGLIDRRGRYAQLIPKPLAIRLASEWWKKTRQEKQVELIESDMPGGLADAFCLQISKLDFLPEVKELIEDLCGPQRPFGQAEVILSARGSRLFRSLVEVNPKATSEALYRILSPFSYEQLKDISGDVRRNLVWALEKLCFHESVFEKSAKCLMWLAAAENETWSNNATGQFLQLFRTFLSGTEAPPEKRLALLDEAIKIEQPSIRELAVHALESSIDTYSGSRSVGAEYQGSGEPLVEWRPKIWQEAFDYWIAALERLTSIALEDGKVSQIAKDAIASHIRGLVQRSYDVMLVLDRSIKQIVTTQGPLWPKALDSIKTAISFDTDKIPDEVKQMLNEWVELLMPKRLEDRIELIVSKPPYEHEKDEDGHYIDIAAINAEKLAQEFSGDIGKLMPSLTQLLSGDQRQGFWFGRYLVLTSKQWEPLLSETIKLVSKLESPNINFLMGLLDGVYELDAEQWNIYITLFKDNNELNNYYSDVIRTGLIEEEHLGNVIKLIESGRIEETSASVFTFGRSLEHLEPKIVTKFIEQLRKISNKTAWISLHILSMYCHGDKDKWDVCEIAFKELLVDLTLVRENKRQQLEMYHWQEAVEKILNNNNSDFAEKITERILLSCNDKIDFGDIHHYIKPVMRLLLKNYGQHVWPLVSGAIREADAVNEYHLSQLLSKEDSFSKKQTSILAELPEDILHEWCRTESDTAPLFIAQSTDVYIEDNGEYEISPRAKFLIDEFGNNKQVLRALSANMGSFGWSGSVVPIYKKEVSALELLLNHKHQTVREWVENRISYLNKAIEKESMHDEEMEWGIR